MTTHKTLTMDEKREIVGLYSSTSHTQKSLAAIYGVTQSGISRVLMPASKARIAAYARCHPRHLEPWTATAVHIDTELGEICNAIVPAPPNPAGPLQWPKGVAHCAAATTTTTEPFATHNAWPAGVIVPLEYYTANTGTDETFETVLDTSADAGSVQHRV
ncbi:hypothetical protein T484DRAFT_1860167 [Baffinella frigidus]|nr:hypothetical protein T484DRAFT_1860167 [Cryptophyta sp. CCMP2293]